MRATTYICLAFWAGLAFGQASLEIIDLRHTTAERVIPTLRPLLEPGGVLTGQRSQLIVRTSPQNLAELRRALAALDRPARRLAISVRFERADEHARSRIEADARVSDRDSRFEIRAREARGATAGRVDQRLQVLEGSPAFIAEGTSRPLQLRDGVLVQDVATGFEVIPRLAGDWVTLEIAPQRAAPGPAGAVGSTRGATTVRARLGEWVEIGGIETLARRDRASRTRRRISVRVDEVGR
ncbi:MAG: secretin N-terminal domain-containing protein [Burkholderiales bacterium]